MNAIRRNNFYEDIRPIFFEYTYRIFTDTITLILI